MKVILLRYGEIHLKGQNRPFFERLLIKSIKEAMRSFENAKVERQQGRYFVKGIADEDVDAAVSALTKVFGLHSLSIAEELPKDIDAIYRAAAEQVRAYMTKHNLVSLTFKVETKRADKNFPMRSNTISADCGGHILANVPGTKVDVHNPQIMPHIEIREEAYVYTEIIPCQGGMPLGASGKCMLLLSGGIDSPVAGYMVAKRGCPIYAVHYESFPYTSERARDKVIALAKIMAAYTGPIHLDLIHFTDIQMSIYEKCPEEMLTIIMRRFMMRIAERRAHDMGCQALITGESIGQVASQTIESLHVTNSAVDLPVFRPLIAMDKLEIMERARNLGTYETSILPYEDCCTVFVPKHPSIRPVLEKVVEAESILDIDALIDDAIARSESIIVRA